VQKITIKQRKAKSSHFLIFHLWINIAREISKISAPLKNPGLVSEVPPGPPFNALEMNNIAITTSSETVSTKQIGIENTPILVTSSNIKPSIPPPKRHAVWPQLPKR